MNGILDHAALYRQRENAGPAEQVRLAPEEHRAFARELVAQNPIMALGLLGAIPSYQVAKMLGLQKARTPASLDQLFAGYRGVGEGLLRAIGR